MFSSIVAELISSPNLQSVLIPEHIRNATTSSTTNAANTTISSSPPSNNSNTSNPSNSSSASTAPTSSTTQSNSSSTTQTTNVAVTTPASWIRLFLNKQTSWQTKWSLSLQSVTNNELVDMVLWPLIACLICQTVFHITSNCKNDSLVLEQAS